MFITVKTYMRYLHPLFLFKKVCFTVILNTQGLDIISAMNCLLFYTWK